jgi:hypothetical protein
MPPVAAVNVAVITCGPAVLKIVVQVAWYVLGEIRAFRARPRDWQFGSDTENDTVPVGMIPPLPVIAGGRAETVAKKVTSRLVTEGFSDDETVVLDGDAVSWTARIEDVLVAKSVVPP